MTVGVATEEVRQLILVDLGLQRGLVTGAQDLDLLLGVAVEEPLHHLPHCVEQQRGVYDEHLPQKFRVVVLPYLARQHDEVLYLRHHAHFNLFQVQDRYYFVDILVELLAHRGKYIAN